MGMPGIKIQSRTDSAKYPLVNPDSTISMLKSFRTELYWMNKMRDNFLCIGVENWEKGQ